MANIVKRVKEVAEPAHTRIYLAAIKLKGISYWIASQGDPVGTFDDQDSIQWGKSLIIEDIVSELKQVAEELEFKDDKSR